MVRIQWAVLTGSRLTANAATQGKSCTEMAHALLPHATPWGCIKQHKHTHCICLAAEAITNHPTLYNHEICRKHSVCCVLRKKIGKIKKKYWKIKEKNTGTWACCNKWLLREQACDDPRAVMHTHIVNLSNPNEVKNTVWGGRVFCRCKHYSWMCRLVPTYHIDEILWIQSLQIAAHANSLSGNLEVSWKLSLKQISSYLCTKKMSDALYNAI